MGFAESTYRQRRAALARALAGAGESGLVLLVGQQDVPYTFAANPYPFRQDSSFLYYFGLAQPGLAALIDIDSGAATLVAEVPHEDVLIWCRPVDRMHMQQSCGAQQLVDFSGARDVLAEAGAQGRALHILPAIRISQHRRQAELLGRAEAATMASPALVRAVVQQREVKSREELDCIAAALDTSMRMHAAVRQAATAGVTERALVGLLEAEAAKCDARMAYPPICTREGHILHHLTYENVLRSGDLLLVDAGAEEANGYASDITRTTCVDGAWNDIQRLMFATVQHTQLSCAARARPGVPMAELHQLAARIIVEGLAPLGLFRGSVDAVLETAAYALVFPHGLGHQLGLDVHDMEALGEDAVGYGGGRVRDTRFGPNHLRLGKPLREGMVITLEPGIYFMPGLWARWRAGGVHAGLINAEVADRLMGQGGLRIEDNFVITKDGAERLGPAIPV